MYRNWYLLVSNLVFLVGVAGCDECRSRLYEASPQSADEPETVEFVVDGDGVFYMTYDARGNRHPYDDSSEIPVAERGRVGVHVDGEMDRERVDERVYAASLIGAAPGDSVTAEWTSTEDFRRQSRASTRGGRRAMGVVRNARVALGLEVETSRPEEASESGGSDRTDENTVVLDSVSDLEERVESGSGGGAFYRESELGKRARAEHRPRRGRTDETEDRHETARYWPVVVYGAEWCPSCQKAKRWLERNDVSYTWRDVDGSAAAKREMKRFCRKRGLKTGAIPTIRIERESKRDRAMQGWRAQAFERIASRD